MARVRDWYPAFVGCNGVLGEGAALGIEVLSELFLRSSGTSGDLASESKKATTESPVPLLRRSAEKGNAQIKVIKHI